LYERVPLQEECHRELNGSTQVPRGAPVPDGRHDGVTGLPDSICTSVTDSLNGAHRAARRT